MKKDTSIQILQLSKRSYNVLEKFNIITVQDLLTVSVEDIKNLKGIGKKSIQEILSKIELLKDHNFDNIDISEIEMKISKDKYFTNKFGEKYKDIRAYIGESFPGDYYKRYLPNLVIEQKPGYVKEALNVDAIVYEKTPYIIALYTAGLGGASPATEEVNLVGLDQVGQISYVINEWHRVNMNP